MEYEGGKVNGPLELDGNPTAPNEAATKNYVDVDHSGGKPAELDVNEEVSGVGIRPSFRAAVVFWTGSDYVHGHGYYEAEIDTVDTFDSPAVQREQSKGTFAIFAGLLPDTHYHARVRGVRADGSVGPWITEAVEDDTPLANSDDIEELTADKISAGTITASISIESPTITGGVFQTDDAGARVVVSSGDARAVSFYDDSGNLSGKIESTPNTPGGFTIEGVGDLLINSSFISFSTTPRVNGVPVSIMGHSHAHGHSGTTGGASNTQTGGTTTSTADADGHSHSVPSHNHFMNHTHSFSA